MPSIGAAMSLRRAYLWDLIKTQPDDVKVKMITIMKAQDRLNRCWPWQRKKIRGIKQELDDLNKKWPKEFKQLYDFWTGDNNEKIALNPSSTYNGLLPPY